MSVEAAVMSDEEYDYEDDGYVYDSDNADDDNNDDVGIEIENAYYEGEDLINSDPLQAIEKFERVIVLETERGDTVTRRFQALKFLVILYFNLRRYDEMIVKYNNMLAYMSSVTRNDCTDAINAILDSVSPATATTAVVNIEVLSKIYEITLVALKSANNERLWFITTLKLAKLYLEAKKFNEVENSLGLLKKSCTNPDGTDDLSKGTNLLETYCLEVQLCSATNNSARMKQLYPKINNKDLKAAVVDPRIMGIIKEEGGKMQLAEGNWDTAYNELYDAFRSYQEAGNSRAKDCLKYVVLASMFSSVGINPFAAVEANLFIKAEDKEIVAMADLRQSLEANDLRRFERILNNPANRILDEPLLMTYIQPLRRRMHEQVLLNITRPYQKASLQLIADELKYDVDEVENLLVDMILDGKLRGSIDQVNRCVILGDNRSSLETLKLKTTANWAIKLNSISEGFHQSINKMS